MIWPLGQHALPVCHGKRDPQRRRPAPQVRSDGRRDQGSHGRLPEGRGHRTGRLQVRHTIDVAKAIEMHPQAKNLLADKATSAGLRRTMVMTAVIMGFPVQG